MPCKVSSASFSNQARHLNGSSILLCGLGFRSLLGQSIEQSIPYHLNQPTTYENLLLVCYGYDNFNVELKTHVPTVDKPSDTLKHLTSGLCFPLQHGITLNNMRCSEKLWVKSPLNPYVEPSDLPPSITIYQLLNIHPEPNPALFSGLSRRSHYNP
jgi:hypothetical protein